MGDKDFPTLGFDPAPGDVYGTRQLSRAIDKLADELGTTVRELDRIDGGQWKGKAAAAFTDHVAEDVAPDMKRAHQSFDKAATALRRWAGDLDGFQEEARGLEREARRKKEALEEAQGLVAAAAAKPYLESPVEEGGRGGGGSDDREAEREKKQQEKREAAAEAAGDALEEVRKRAEELRERYFRSADAICRQLDTAAGIAPDEPGLFDRIASGVSDVLGDTLDWVQDHADLIKAIGDVLGYVTAALTVLAIATAPFPPIGAAFASAALVYAGLTLLTHGVAKAAGADVSWATLGLEALGLIPGMGLFAKGVKIVGRGAAEARVAQLGGRFAMRRVGSVRNIVSTGDLAGTVQGGLKLTIAGKGVALWGKNHNVFMVADDFSKVNTKLAAITEPTRRGRMLGSMGLDIVTGGRVAVDPMSVGGRLLDTGTKVAPQLAAPIVEHLPGDPVGSLGDRLQGAFS
ncbi:WXG100 family type VII secretion target [Streptomyces sp. MAR4 CNX-425]|uniref:WXG100 family type VII secretion target n=1 Tax=Streptomyces sp. MAR4 CNX-425 TaxID=3406343 RepID=UPI003B50FBCF